MIRERQMMRVSTQRGLLRFSLLGSDFVLAAYAVGVECAVFRLQSIWCAAYMLHTRVRVKNVYADLNK